MLRQMLKFRLAPPTTMLRHHSGGAGCCGGHHEQSAAEKTMSDLLTAGIGGCTKVEVHDVSNGCGSMFDVTVEATSFAGKSKVAQHKQVTGILRDQIKDMHGLTIRTKAA